MSEEFKYSTRAEIIEQQLKEDFGLEILDLSYRDAAVYDDTEAEIEQFCDDLQETFDELVSLLSSQAKEDLFFFKDESSGITPSRIGD